MSTTPKSLISTLSRISVLSCVALAAATQDGKVAPPKPSQVAPANPATAQPAPPAGIATPAKPGTAAPVDARQAIRFEPEVLNLGEMSAEVAKTGTIKVINVLDTPVTITKIVPGCGCTTTSAPPAPLAPGESANVDITLKPGSKAGIQLTKMVTFQIEGHAPQMLTVKGDVKAYIALSQDMVDGPTSDTAPPTTIKLTSVENVPFRVTSVLPDVLVEVPKESKTEQEVQIDWKKWEATGSSVKISIMTDNPKAPQLGILVKRSLKAGATPPPATTQAETSPASVLAVRGGDMTALKTAIAAPGEVWTPKGMRPHAMPRELRDDEIPGIVAGFRAAARNAKAAGFDGVELHGANGYLLDQFLRDGSNRRSGPYGGPLANRARLMLEVVDAACAELGAGRVGLRISPLNSYNDMRDSDPVGMAAYVAAEADRRGIAYLHLMRADFAGKQSGDVVTPVRKAFRGTLVLNMGFTVEEAERTVEAGTADAIAFGTAFLANPDLPARIAAHAPLNVPDPSTFYAGGAKGYTDYPAMAPAAHSWGACSAFVGRLRRIRGAPAAH